MFWCWLCFNLNFIDLGRQCWSGNIQQDGVDLAGPARPYLFLPLCCPNGGRQRGVNRTLTLERGRKSDRFLRASCLCGIWTVVPLSVCVTTSTLKRRKWSLIYTARWFQVLVAIYIFKHQLVTIHNLGMPNQYILLHDEVSPMVCHRGVLLFLLDVDWNFILNESWIFFFFQIKSASFVVLERCPTSVWG